MPTFAPGYVPPGFYVEQADISSPNVTPGVRISAIIGQGAKTLGRQEVLTKGVLNGQDGPLSFDTVINIAALVDENGVIYTQGRDFKLKRDTGKAYVDWSVAGTASLTGTTDITALQPSVSAALDGTHLRITVNGVSYDIVLTTPADAAAVVTQVNAWDPALAGLASLSGGKYLVLSANTVQTTVGNANTVLGFTDWKTIGALEPIAETKYTVSYVSDKLDAEYLPRIFTDVNKIVAAYGEKRPQVALESGAVVSSGTATAVVKTSKVWALDQLVGAYIKISSGVGKGQVRVIIGNTVPAGNPASMTVTVSQDWTDLLDPDATSNFVITDVNENSISKGCEMARNTGATAFITTQYADDIFNDPNIKAAIDALKNDIQGFRPYCLTLMKGLGATEVDPISYIKAQLVLESDVLHNRWRMSTFGLAQGNDDFAVIAQLARGTASDRMFMPNISEVVRDFGFGKEHLDGSYLAAAYAGIFCANEDAGEPFTNRSVAAALSVSDFVDPFKYDEKNFMAAAGASIFERQGNDVVLRDDISTDPSTKLKKYGRLLRMKDFISDFIKSGLEKLTVGQRMLPNTGSGDDIVSRTTANFKFLILQLQTPANKSKIVRVDNLSVTANALESDQLDIHADIILVNEVKYVYALIGFAPGV